MLAREWAVACRYGSPASYGVPELPAWDTAREDGRLVMSDGEAFVAAAEPVRVRR